MKYLFKTEESQIRDAEVYIQNKNVISMWLFFFTQIAFCILYGVIIRIDVPGGKELMSEVIIQILFLLILIIVGFGLALGHSYKMLLSNLGFNLLITAFVFQSYFLYNALWLRVGVTKSHFSNQDDRFFVNKTYIYDIQDQFNYGHFGNNIVQAIKCALACIVSFSFIAGRVGLLQIYLISIIQPFIYEICRQVCLYAFDYEIGTIKIFLFGGLFGLMMSIILNRHGKQANIIDHYHHSHNRYSMILSLLGVFICWTLFPLLTTTYGTENYEQQFGFLIPISQGFRVFSIVLAMSSSGLLGIVLGYYNFGFKMVIYSILGAGVAVLSSSAYIANPVYAIVFGIISCIVQYLFLFINKKIRAKVGPYDPHDFVFIGHGFLGIFYQVINRAIVMSNPDKLHYSFNYSKLAGFIILDGAITIAFAVISGIVVGVLFSCFSVHQEQDHFTDASYWVRGDGISVSSKPIVETIVKEQKPTKEQQIFFIQRHYPIKQKNAYL